MTYLEHFSAPNSPNGLNILEYAVFITFILIFTSFGYVAAQREYFSVLTLKIAYFELMGVTCGTPHLPIELGTQFHV